MAAKKVLTGFRQFLIDSIHEYETEWDEGYRLGGYFTVESACEAGRAFLENATTWEQSTTTPILLGEENGSDIPEIFSFCFFHEAISRGAGDMWFDKYSYGYLFQDSVYVVGGHYSREQEALLIQEAFDAERQKFERLKKKFDPNASADIRPVRSAIAEDVRIAVWRRDGGCCSKCGSRERLEYDHIVPVSRGGSNTVRNIELLCETCNRSKSDNIQ